ncbi:mCG1026316 [Mus musculus]|nr:mCG1026316 [Mus musculus]
MRSFVQMSSHLQHSTIDWPTELIFPQVTVKNLYM